MSSSLVDQTWELVDPNPNIHELFMTFNQEYFYGLLGPCSVNWSKRMTLCAGVCSYSRHGGCSIRLSQPLLSLRSRKDLVETLLHEMIHAYLFITMGTAERQEHGPKFIANMDRINKMAGTNITVYHTFHDEVKHFQNHVWRCEGRCKSQAPYYGLVRRSMNRPPGPNDFWYKDHQASCGGKFLKISEPSPKKKPSSSTHSQRKMKGEKEMLKGQAPITQYYSSSTNGSENSNAKEKKDSPSGGGQMTGSNQNTPVKKDLNGEKSSNKRKGLFGPPEELETPVVSRSNVPFPGQGIALSTHPPRKLTRGDHPLLSKWKGGTDGKPSTPPVSPSASGGKKDEELFNTSWEDLFKDKKKSEQKEVIDLSFDDDEVEDACPGCGYLYVNLEEHMKNCSGFAQAGPSRSRNGENQQCPVCQDYFTQATINDHLDECLTNQIG